jgi:hypothetical protein
VSNKIFLQKLEKSSEDVVVAVNEQEENKTNEKEDIDNGPGEFEKESNKEEMGSVAAAESLGFFKDIDIAKKQTEKHELENIQEISVNNGKNIKEEDSSMGNHPTHALSVNNLPPLPHVSFPGIKFKIPRVSLRGKSMVWYPILGVFLFVLLIVSYYYFFEKAQVILVLSKKDITKNVSVTFSQEKQTSAQDSVVHIEELAVQVDGKEEQSTTGKKETGDNDDVPIEAHENALALHKEAYKEDEWALLKRLVKNYKMPVTHLNNFVNISEGGPLYFIEQNLLRFPQPMNPSGVYGSAIHKAIEEIVMYPKYHTGEKAPLQYLVTVFTKELSPRRR